jgi:hypothetical protein
MRILVSRAEAGIGTAEQRLTEQRTDLLVASSLASMSSPAVVETPTRSDD